MPDPNKTLIVLLLDRSGSMEFIRDATIASVNNYLAEQREQPGECAVTLVQFDAKSTWPTPGGDMHSDWYLPVYVGQPIQNVPPLSRATFVPRGGTALHDAMCRCIKETGERLAATPEGDRPGQVLFVTMTDGMENQSRKYSKQNVADAVRHQTDVYNWRFVYLGANQDAVQVGKSLGIDADSSLTYNANAGSLRASGASLSTYTTNFRSGNAANFTEADRRSANQ